MIKLKIPSVTILTGKLENFNRKERKKLTVISKKVTVTIPSFLIVKSLKALLITYNREA